MIDVLVVCCSLGGSLVGDPPIDGWVGGRMDSLGCLYRLSYNAEWGRQSKGALTATIHERLLALKYGYPMHEWRCGGRELGLDQRSCGGRWWYGRCCH